MAKKHMKKRTKKSPRRPAARAAQARPARARKRAPAKRAARAKAKAKKPVRAAAAARVKAGTRAKAAKAPTRRPARPAARPTQSARRPSPTKRAPARPATPAARPPTLERQRRQLSDAERLASAAPSSDARTLSAAKAGYADLKAQMKRHTESSPALTAGDVDADWQDAYALGDEAPGGDNPTPDQNRVDQIGKALGIEYQDDQELEGGDEVVDRDDHRWELDPASSDDWPHKDEE